MKELKIYFTSDLHGYVYPTDYTDNETKAMGLLSINQSIEKDENTLLIDGGDTIQGSSFSSYIVDKGSYEINPIADIMNRVGYDYITLGNHDFNYGYDYLMNYINDLEATCLCANVNFKDYNSESPIFNYEIKEMENGLKVGIVGITTDFINIWEKKENVENFIISDAYKAAKEYHDLIKKESDILVGIYHGGFEYDLDSHRQLSDTSENIAYKISKTLEFDLLLTGHQHIPIAGKEIFGTHIVQTPMNGLQFAEININVNESMDAKISSQLIKPKIDTHSNVYNDYIHMENQVQTYLNEPIGKLDQALTPESHIEMAYEGSLIANVVNQIQLEASGADISCTSLGNRVTGLPMEVTLRDIVSTYIYPNTLMVLEINGAILRQALERVASYFAIEEDEVKVSELFMKPKVEHYNYDYFSGIKYEFDITKAIGKRVTKLEFQGQPVKKDNIFSLVMNNYRASGAGGYDYYRGCKVLKDLQISMTDIIVDYIRNTGKVIVDKSKYYNICK